ncbi:filamentous hemagglutinin N-terminal domain-containing protein [Niveispirillum fermenti]|uniref:filamentous hemagglutinin N-terminal domain-containing protein n=1 Tax=Niveispirillum fermenti TaxID=1233113 RepID=UPI003A8A930A
MDKRRGTHSTPSVSVGLPGSRRQRHNLRDNLMASAAALLGPGGRGGPKGTRRQRRAGVAVAVGGFAYALSSLFTQAAWANPTGGTVVAGQASIVAATPQTLNIIQGTDKAIINWQGFSIAAGETVNFLQPGAQSVTLNRVVGNDPSAIFGSITANGTVMLVNPNGVVFGKGSRVDVGGLVATTANITDADFLAGNYAFNQASANLNAGIVNEGLISIKDSGLAALVAPSVRNSGIIQARLGKVALGGAKRFTLDFQGDGLLSFDAGSIVTDLPQGADGKAQALVVNSGQITAEGGTVVLSARAVKGVIDNVVNTDGIITATSISGSNGRIVLSGGDGKIAVAGTVDASGRQDGQSGGTVIVDAADIAVAAGTRIDASGDLGGGTIAVGSAGDRDGAWAAGQVTVGAGAVLAADAVTRGDGGTVTVLSDMRTAFAGSITARGGAEGGDGGFAEVSSRDRISLTGGVDLTAAKGKTGTFLLDPSTLKIVAGSTGSLNGNAGDGTIAAGDADSGDNTVAAATLEAINATTNIVLEATGLITVDTSLDLQTGTGNSFTLRSTAVNGGITFTSATHEIKTAGGSITLDASLAGSSLTNIGRLTSNGGNITLISGDRVSLAGAIDAGAGAVKIDASAGNITNVAGSPVLTGGSVSLSALGGHVGASGAAISTSTGVLSVATGGNIHVSNATALSGLSITANHVASSDANIYSISATGLAFTVTDGANGQTLTNISSPGNLNFSFTSDKGLAIGILNAGSGDVALTANGGDITSTGASPLITGNALTLVARGTTGTNGAIGATGSPLSTAVTSLTSTSGSGIINIDNTGALSLNSVTTGSTVLSTIKATGTITVGAITNQAFSPGNFSLQSTTGSIIDDGDSATLIRSSGGLVLQAGGAIGSPTDAITAVGATSLLANAGNGGVYFTNAGSSDSANTIFSEVRANNGDIVLKVTRGSANLHDIAIASGAGNIDVSVANNLSYGTINAGSGNVTLTVDGTTTSQSGGTGITGDKLKVVATNATHTMTLLTQVNEIDAVSASSLTLTQTGSVTLKRLASATINATVEGDGAETTVGTLGTATFSGTVSLTTSGKIIAAAGNKVGGTGVTITAGGDVGADAARLDTRTGVLSVTNTGSFFIDNDSHLTRLTINNKHTGSTPNSFVLTALSQTFDVTDNGTTVTISDISNSFLTSFSFTSDKNLVLGRLRIADSTTGNAAPPSASITTTEGSILDDGNRNTFLSASVLKLSATEGVGANGAALGISTQDLEVTTAGDLVIANESYFNRLVIASTHKDADADYMFGITGQSLDVSLTDGPDGYLFTRLISNGGWDESRGLNIFSFTGDRDITLGEVNIGSLEFSMPSPMGGASTKTLNTVLFKSTTGAIKDDGSDSTRVLAGAVNLQAAKSVGASDAGMDIDIVARAIAVYAGTGSGLADGEAGIYVTASSIVNPTNADSALLVGKGGAFTDNFRTSNGDIVLRLLAGDIEISSSTVGTTKGALTMEALSGSILSSTSSNTIRSTGKMELKASQNIGTSATLLQVDAGELVAEATAGIINVRANAFTGGDTLTLTKVVAGGDSLTLSSSGALDLGEIKAGGGTGAISITASGAINDDSETDARVEGGSISLRASSSNSIGSSRQLKLKTGKLTVEGKSTIDIDNDQALTSLDIIRDSGSGSVSISGTGQTVSISGAGSLATLTSATDLDFSLTVKGGTVGLGAANVGAGKFVVVGDGAITKTGGGSDRIVAGSVSLTAGTSSSIGSSSSPILISSTKLDVSAGRDIYVGSDVGLTHLTIASTNSTTASNTASLFGITGPAGEVVALTDNGTTLTVDVVGSAGLTDFGLSASKNIAVSEIVVSGAVTLKTEGGGANSSLSLSGGGTVIASSVTLVATGTGSDGGAIGSSSRAFKTSAASLSVTNNGNIYINNSNTALTTLAVTNTHKTTSLTDINTISFINVGSGRSVTVTEAGGVTTVGANSGAGIMDFSYSVDRAIRVSSIDAGTSTTGKVTLKSTGSAGSGGSTVYSFITGNNQDGTITAGEVSLTATGSNTGGIGNNDAMFFVDTKKLYIKSGGSVRWDNATTLTDLTLDLSFETTGSVNSGSYTYEVYGSNNPSLSLNVAVLNNSVSGLNIQNISQTSSPLNLTVLSTKQINVSGINVGTGTVKLQAGTTSGDTFSGATVNASRSTSVITAGRLEIMASSVGNSQSGQSTFFGTVGTLKINATGDVNYQNAGDLVLDGVSNRTTSDGRSITLAVTNGNLTQAVGSTGGLFTNDLTLKVENGSIGTSETSLLIEAESLTLTSGLNVYLNNLADLDKFDWTLRHSSAINQYSITGVNLTVNMPASLASGSTTINTFTDTSGLDLSISTDTSLVVGNIDVQKGRSLSLTTTGTAKSISTLGGGMTMRAGRINLTATGSAGTSASTLRTHTEALFINTVDDVYINNSAADLQTLSIKNSRTSGDGAAAYSLLSGNATISISGSSSYALAVTDTTGLDFTFETKISQIVGIVDLTKAGTLTLKSEASLFGGANSSLSRITAGSLSLDAMLLGSTGARFYIDAPVVTLKAQGDVYVTSSTHIDKLSLTNSSSSSTADRTFDIVSAGLDGTAGTVQVQATHTNTGGTVFSQITDTSGMDFSFTGDRLVTVDSVEIGAANRLTLSGNSGIQELDDASYIKAGVVHLIASSGAVGQTAGTGGGLLDITTGYLKISANNGALVDLKQKAKVAGITVAGTSVFQISSGDLDIGSPDDTDGGWSLNGAAVTVNVVNGSILGGGFISGSGDLTLTASGAIGADGKALGISAASNGTTTLTATAAGGGIYLTESQALTISSMNAAGDVVVAAGNGQQQKDLTIAGAITATGHKVTLTAANAAIKSDTSSVIDAAELVLTAMGGANAGAGAIGASTNANTRVKTTATKLTINTGGNIVVGSNSDLTDLTIDRKTSQNNTSSSGTLSVTATNLTFTASDNGTTTTLTNISDTTGLNLTISAKGNIAVGTISVGSGSVDLNTAAFTTTNAATSITAINGSSLITAGSLSLATNSYTGAGIGTSSQAVLTSVSRLTLNTASGGAYVSNAGALTTGALTSNGALSVKTGSGDLTLDGAVSWGSSAALTLEAGGHLRSNGIGLTAGGTSASINLKAGSGIGTASDVFRITASNAGGTGSLVSATVTGDGSAYLAFTGGVNGGLSTSVKNGSTIVTAGGTVVIGTMTITDDAAGNDIRVTANGSITIGSTGTAGSVSTGMGEGQVVLTALSGGIQQGNNGSSISGGTVTLNATAGYGSSSAALGVNSRDLTAVSSTAGLGTYLKATGTELGLSNIVTNGGVISVTGANTAISLGRLVSGGSDINVEATGISNLQVGIVDASGGGTGNVTLSAGSGSITDDELSSTGITGNTVTLTAGTGIGTSTHAVNTHAVTLLGGTSGTGSVHLADGNSAGVSLGNSSTGLTVNDGSLTVTAAGPLAVVNVVQSTDGAGKDVTLSTTSGDVTITKLYAGASVSTGAPSSSQASVTAAGGITTVGNDTHIIAGKLSLTANDGNIGAVTNMATGDGTPVLVKVSSITGLSAAKAAAVVSISNSGTGTSTLGSGALTLGTGASAYIKTAGDLSVEGLSLSSGNLLLESGGTLTLPSSGSFSTTGAVTLKGTTDIVSSGGGRTVSVTASALTFVSGSAGGDTTLTTTVDTLDASLTGNDKNLIVTNTGEVSSLTLAANGDVTFTNSVGFTATDISATGANRTITLTATTGDLTLDTINAGATGTLTLLAATGSVLSADGGATLTGETLNLTTFTGVGSADAAFDTTFTKISANVTGVGGIYLSGTSFQLGDLTTTNGDIVVTTTGNITDTNMVNGFSAGTSGNVTLKSTGGSVTLTKDFNSTGSDATKAGLAIEANSITVAAVGTAGAQEYKGNTTLTGDLTGKSVTITGNATLGGSNSAVTINTSPFNGDIGISGTITGGGKGLTLTAGTGTATLGGAATGLASLAATAGTISAAGASSTGAQAYTGATTLSGTYAITGTGNFGVTGALTLGGDTTIGAGANQINLSSTVNGAYALALNGTGAVTVGGAVGGTTALASLTTDTGGTGSFKSVRTTGTQSYGSGVTLDGTYATTNSAVTFSGAVTLGGNTTVSTGSGNATFSGAVDGARTLTVNSTGATSFAAAVGGTTALSSLTTDAGGTVSLQAVTTTLSQSYGENATLNGNLTTTANGAVTLAGAVQLGGATTIATGSGAIQVTGTIDGAHALTLNSAGTTALSGAVGGTTALASLTTNAGGTLTLKSVSTTGAQTYGETSVTLDGIYTVGTVDFTASNNFILAGDTTINAGANAINLTGTINGAHALALNSTGATTLTGAVGGTTALASLTTNAGGTSSLRSVTTAGGQTYNDAVTLNGTYTTGNGDFLTAQALTLGGNVTVSAGTGGVTFQGTVDGTHALTVNSQGATLFSGVVGGTTALASLITDAGGTTTLGNVTTNGVITIGDAATIGGTYTSNNNWTISFAGPVTLTADTTVAAGSGAITFGGTIDGAHALVLNSTGVTTLSGVAGGTTALTSITTNAGGSAILTGVITTGEQTYNDDVTLSGLFQTSDATFDAKGNVTLAGATTVETGTAGLEFAGTVNGGHALTITTSGDTKFNAVVGGTTALASLTTTGSGNVTAISVYTSGDQTYAGNATLNGTYSLAGGAFLTSGGLTLAGDVTITGGNVTFSSNVDGAHALTISSTGATTANAAIGEGTALASLTTSGGAINLQSVTTTGAQSLGGSGGSLNGTYGAGSFTLTSAVSLAGNTTVSAGSITISATIDGGSDLTLNSSGATNVSAALGGSQALGSLTTDSGGTSSFVGVSTSGAQTFNDAVTLSGSFAAGGLVANAGATLAGATTIDSGATFNGGIGGGFDLTVNAGSSDVSFNGAVNGLGALAVNSGGLTKFSSAGVSAFSIVTDGAGSLDLGGATTVTTTGAQSYGEVLNLTGDTVLTASAVTLSQGAQGSHALTVNSDLTLGAGASINSLTVSGLTSINGGVNTSGKQDYKGGALITGDLELNAGGGVDFGGSVDGDGALTVNSADTTRFGGTVRLGSLTTDAGGTVVLSGAVTTSGAQTYGEQLRIDDETVLTGSTVTLSAGAEGSSSLTINGDADIAGDVGAQTALASLSVSGGTRLGGGTVRTSGDQQYGGLLTLSGDTTLSGTSVTLGDGATGGGLTIQGNAVLQGGQGVTLDSLSVTGATLLDGGTMATTGSQTYGGAVTLTGDQILTTSSGHIDFGGTIDGAADLTINAGASDVIFTGAVGSTTRLGTLTINSAGLTSFAAAGMNMTSVVTDAAGTLNLNGGAITTVGAQSYGEAVTLTIDTVLTGSSVTLGQGATGGRVLTINGDADLAGSIDVAALAISGNTLLRSGAVKTSGTQTYGGGLTLASDTVLEGALITVDQGVDGAFALTIRGNAAFGGAPGAGTPLASLDIAGDTLLNGGSITTSGAQSFTGTVTLGGDATLTGGSVDFQGAVEGPAGLTVNSPGLTRFGGTINVGSLTTDGAGSLSLASSAITTTGAQNYGERLTLVADTVLTGSSVTLNQGADGAFALTIRGDAGFGGALGAEQALTRVDVSGGTVLSGGSITTSGSQAYGGAVTLNGSTVLTGGSVDFQGAVTGPAGLTVNSDGLTRFGGTVTLGSLTTDAGGSLSMAANSVTTTGAQNYGERLLLTADTVLTGSSVTLAQGAEGDHGLSVEGDAVFGGTVSLGSVAVSGTADLNGGAVTTTGDQSYGAARLGSAAVLAAGGDVLFAGTVTGAHALTVDAAGLTRFGGAVDLASLATDAAGSLLLGGSVTTTGAQTYGERALIGGNIVLTGSTITLSQGADGSDAAAAAPAGALAAPGRYALVVTGDLVTGGAVGGVTALESLAVSGSTVLGGDVTTTGDQTYGGALTLAGDTRLTGGLVTINGAGSGHGLTIAGDAAINGIVSLAGLNVSGTTLLNSDVATLGGQTYAGLVTLGRDAVLTGSLVSLNGADGAHALAITGDAVIAGAVGAGTALAGLSVGGTTLLSANVTSTGAQTYAGAVTLGDDVALSGGTVAFNGTIDGAHALSVTGPVGFAGVVGGQQALSGLVVRGAARVDGGAIDTTGTQHWEGAVTLGRDTRFGTAGGDALFDGTIDGAFALSIDSSGLTRLGGAVSVASIVTDAAGSLTLTGGSITTSGNQTFGERAVLGSDMLLTGGLVTLAGGVDGAHALSITGDGVINGAVGGTAALTSFSVGGRTQLNGSVATTGAQSYTGPVTLLANAGLTSSGGSMTFGGTVDSNGGASLTITAGGAVAFNGAVNTGALAVTGQDTTFGGTVTTGNLVVTGHNVTFSGAITAADMTVTGRDMTFNGAVTSSGRISLTSNNASGTITFAGSAHVQAASGFTQAGGARVLLPTTVTVTLGDITLEAPAELPAGAASISTSGNITMAGLVGPGTNLTLSAGTGALKIGVSGGAAAQTLQVLTLTVPTAGSASMFGTIGTNAGAAAAKAVDSSYRGAPYFLNNVAWGPVEDVTQVVSTIVPRNPVPSTPTVASLFTGTVTSSGVTPNALSAYQAPQVLTNVGLLETGGSVSVLQTSPAAGAAGGVGSGAAGSSSPSVLAAPDGTAPAGAGSQPSSEATSDGQGTANSEEEEGRPRN